MKYIERIIKNNNGFTLVETLLVIFVFSVIMVLMGGVFVSSLNLQRRAFNLQKTEDNAAFILESMAKEVRVSQITSGVTNCPSAPALSLSLNHPINGSITYSLSGNAIHRNAGGSDTIVSSNTVEFTNIKFCITGNAVNDDRQPRVIVFGSVRSSKTKQQAVINFQTTLSQRFLSD
ncbi:MAG TPA: type II secretion system protein [Candidatus Paceibacterota bacterium]